MKHATSGMLYLMDILLSNFPNALTLNIRKNDITVFSYCYQRIKTLFILINNYQKVQIIYLSKSNFNTFYSNGKQLIIILIDLSAVLQQFNDCTCYSCDNYVNKLQRLSQS